MKKLLLLVSTLLLFCLLPLQSALAENPPYLYEPSSDLYFSAEELEDLLAPIALYPDPLIAQILPAATFIDQIDQAARYVKRYGPGRVDIQPWDVSIKSVAHYPDLLLMMDRDYDWTVSLGQAFINQPQEVMSAIQRLRADAMDMGNLVSTREQQVVMEGDYIRIYPAAPQVIYIPSYDPRIVYVERSHPGYGLINFGIGLSIGVWLNRDFDWYGHRIYYHGWQGDGWIRRARPHVHVHNTYYVNNSYRVINRNRGIMYHDVNRYREQIRRDRYERRPPPGRPISPLRERHTPVINKTPGGRPLPPPAYQQPRPQRPDFRPSPPRVKDRAEELRAVKPTVSRPHQPHREQRGMQTAPPKQPPAAPATARPAVVRPAPATTSPPAATKPAPVVPAVKPPPAAHPAPKAPAAGTDKERPQRPGKPEKQEQNENREPQGEGRHKR